MFSFFFFPRYQPFPRALSLSVSLRHYVYTRVICQSDDYYCYNTFFGRPRRGRRRRRFDFPRCVSVSAMPIESAPRERYNMDTLQSFLWYSYIKNIIIIVSFCLHSFDDTTSKTILYPPKWKLRKLYEATFSTRSVLQIRSTCLIHTKPLGAHCSLAFQVTPRPIICLNQNLNIIRSILT